MRGRAEARVRGSRVRESCAALVCGVVRLLHGGTDPAPVADLVTAALGPLTHLGQVLRGPRTPPLLEAGTERRRPCLVALAIYGFSAFCSALRFFALRSMVHDSLSRLKVTSLAFADPSRSSVTVTVVCLAMSAILTPQADRCPIRCFDQTSRRASAVGLLLLVHNGAGDWRALKRRNNVAPPTPSLRLLGQQEPRKGSREPRWHARDERREARTGCRWSRDDFAWERR